MVKSEKRVATDGNSTTLRPVLILLAGTAGSGKATFYESELKTAFPSIVSASTSPIEQVKMNKERTRLLEEGHPFVYRDTTIDFQVIREGREAGFDVKLLYVGTEDPNLNIGRVLLRVGHGGQFASLARIPDDYALGIKQLLKAKRAADELAVFDNTAHGRGHRLVAHFEFGELMRLTRSVPKWAQKAFEKEFAEWLGDEGGS